MRDMVAGIWFREVEYLRGFAALAVIAVHVSMNFTRLPGAGLPALVGIFVYIAAHFAVPVFVFISGWVLAARYRGGYPVPAYYRRRARTILPPYILFSALYLPIVVEGAMAFAGMPAPGAMVGALLMGTAAYHLWFFVVIIQLYILYPLIAGVYDRFDRAGAALFLLLALLFVQVLWNVGAHAAGAFAGTEWYAVLIRLFPSHLLYFVLGVHVARHTDRFRSMPGSLSPAWVVAAAGAGALLTGGIWVAAVYLSGGFAGATLGVFCVYRIIEPFYYVPVIAALVVAARRLERGGGRSAGAFRSFGAHSFGIYLIHPIVIAAGAAAWAALTGWTWADWPTYPVLFVVAAAVSYGAVRAASAVPYAGYLLGEPRALPATERS